MRAIVRRSVLVVAACAAACSTAPPMPEPGQDHPASPSAEEAPRAPIGDTLRLAAPGERR